MSPALAVGFLALCTTEAYGYLKLDIWGFLYTPNVGDLVSMVGELDPPCQN